MPYYESVFIARQDIAAAQVETLTDEFAQLIKDQGGEIAKREYWGLKNLSFKIKKNRKGHYVLFSLDAPSSAIHEFERVMRYNEDVLRYMTVKVKELDPEPSPMMQSRDERGRGGRRDDRGREDRGRGGGRPPRREEN
ncbi:30S ribosomal protein S6 [Fodinicurvata sediminis]|uniref:30S ribosomal protein S6 n=1 Tax=Fodinicurvata sediminis TaxID=1121832 RepID=UPI0003B5C5EB|nr:30S ribosomal protein S6 [Fodinicurvata sediminis]